VRVVATAGHVDHGKSSLVLALTGTDPDRFEEEKRRGLTIDIGFAHMALPSGEGVSFVDVPGHVRFLRNMLAGVGGVDACLFVVAATEGWKPQSEEHLRILELVGVQHGLIALTKVDAVDAEWRELAAMDVADHVSGTFLEGAPVVGVSSLTGEGLAELTVALDALVASTPGSVDRGRPRLWIDRVFAAKGSGTVVTGTLTGGRVSVGDHLEVVAASSQQGRPVRVRAIQSLGRTLDTIGPGNRAALNLVGVEHAELARGDAVVEPRRWRPTSRLDATLRVLAGLDHDVTRRGAYAAYVGAGEFPARVRVLGPEGIGPGSEGSIRLHLQRPLPLLPGDRFVLRESGRNETVGGGEVLDIAPVRPAARARPDRSVDRVIAERGWVDVDDLDAMTGERRAPTIGHWVTAPGQIEALTERVIEDVTAAGPLGLDIASLDERARAVVERTPELVVDVGRVRLVQAEDPLADHPFVAALQAGGLAPPPPDQVDRATLRELVKRGIAVERDGVVFHRDAIDRAAHVAADLLRTRPDGFTVAEFRDATGASRKFALPLVGELDARGVTRRRGDLRIGGPRLPHVEP
jgi:selenocysteine-specific elongation factor